MIGLGGLGHTGLKSAKAFGARIGLFAASRHKAADGVRLGAGKGITANIEPIRIQQINEAYERLLKSGVKYRFVIDVSSLG